MAPCPVSANPQAVCRRKRSPEHRLAERRTRQGKRSHLPTPLKRHVTPLLRSLGSTGDGGPVRSLRHVFAWEGACGGRCASGIRRYGHALDRKLLRLVPASRAARHPAVSRWKPRPDPPLRSALAQGLGHRNPPHPPRLRRGRQRQRQLLDPHRRRMAACLRSRAQNDIERHPVRRWRRGP